MLEPLEMLSTLLKGTKNRKHLPVDKSAKDELVYLPTMVLAIFFLLLE